MKAITTEDRLNEAGRMIQHIVERAENNIKEYMEAAQEDFCNFFHWHAAGMYQAQKTRAYFSAMPQVTKYDDIKVLIKAMNKRIKNIENELINSSAFGTCCNEVVNLEHRLDLDSKRVIREKLLNILWVLEED